MAKIYIDDKQYEVRDGQNLLQAIISLGIDLPYFCWHPALGSVGACRQCAVIQYKDENDDKGKLVMACMVPVQDGLRCSVKAPDAAKMRENVIEWLMINHPHDCPVCDEGGECHLQDMTVMAGHNYRRYRFTKRTFKNQDLGPFIYHEMNRCITCYRCVRFYHDYAGGDDLQAFGAHDHVYFGRYEDGTLESEFSGNLVEVCPTGVFTDKTLRKHYTRKWDLQSGPSVCQHCGLGCNTLAGERYDKLVRILNRYNREVNGYFICDRGRFGYENVNSEKRLHGSVSGRSDRKALSREEALTAIASAVSKDKKLLGIGSPRASLETNHSLQTLVGKDNFFQGITHSQWRIRKTIVSEMQKSPAPTASIHNVEQADAVLVLGEDLTNTAPMLALAVRQAVRNEPMKNADKLKIPRWQDNAVRELMQDERGPFYQATISANKLDRIAAESLRLAPREIARFGFAVAHAIDGRTGEVNGLSDKLRELAKKIADALKNADRPVIIAGESLGDESIVKAAANCVLALQKTSAKGEVAYVVPECNSIGLTMLGGGDIESALKRVDSGDVDTLIVAECDLYRICEESRLDNVIEKVKHLICIDHFKTLTAERADFALAATTFAGGDGTLVNNEGRAQRFFQALNPSPEIQEAWRWAADIMEIRGMDEAGRFQNLDSAVQAVFDHLGEKHNLAAVAPDSSFSVHGRKIARSPHRYSGRTAMHANVAIHEPKPPDDGDSPLSFSMEGVHDQQPGSLIPFFWSPGWNSVQSTQSYMKEVGGELRGGDPGLRLFEPSEKSEGDYYTEVPEPFETPQGKLLAVPLSLIYGSEELSNASAPIRERIPAPYASMNKRMLDEYDISAGAKVDVIFEDLKVTVTIKEDDSIPNGIVAIVAGHADLPPLTLPSIVTVSAGEK